MCTPQKRPNDWNVILSADWAYVKPVKRSLSRWTNGFRCRRAEDANKIFFSRQARCDLVDLRLVDRSAGHCVTRLASEHDHCEHRVDNLSCFVHRMNGLR